MSIDIPFSPLNILAISLFVITLVSPRVLSPNVYVLLFPAMIVKGLFVSPVIEVIPVSVLLNPYFIPLASLLTAILSPALNKSSSPALTVAPSDAPSALAVNSLLAFKFLMPSLSFQAFALSASIFEASFLAKLSPREVIKVLFFASLSAFTDTVYVSLSFAVVFPTSTIS